MRFLIQIAVTLNKFMICYSFIYFVSVAYQAVRCVFIKVRFIMIHSFIKQIATKIIGRG